MGTDIDYGERLSDEEYDRAVVQLQEGLPPVPSREQRRQLRRAELELAIDHRLGRAFPRSRRDALWAVQQKVERRRLRLVFKYLWKRLFRGDIVQDAQGLAGFLVDEYATVLSRPELERFFGKQEVANPALPVDQNRPDD